MRPLKIALLTCLFMPCALAKTVVQTEIVEEQEKSEVKVFCSKTDEKDALRLCESWLEKQSKSLKERLLTSFCSRGDQSNDASCLYKANGELKYVLKTYRTNSLKD